MVYTALKLKKHLTVSSPTLANPNILVLTDRVDLDDQISGTFIACGLPNPERMEKVQDLRDLLSTKSDGLMVLSTIFKFQGSRKPIENSKNWIVLVDECHRTQEKDLGAYLRATLPEALFFGFTGTPIKKTDKDTYANFGEPGEGYLDKYGIVLFERSERSPVPAYRDYQRRLVEYNCYFAARIHNATTPAQRQKARETLKGWEDDRRSLLASAAPP